MKATYWGETNIGKVRSKNEDRLVIEEIWNGTHLLATVIDGVGGNGGGDYAAEIARNSILDTLREITDRNNDFDILKSAVIFANNQIYSQHTIPTLSNMSCVLTAVLINLQNYTMNICHVGDTRLYKYSNGELTKLTSDHSPVGQMEDAGRLSEWEAMRHPMRNVIYRSVGKDMLSFDTEYIDYLTIKLEPCTLLLCSDGLTDMVDTTQITKILSEPTSAEERTQKLIDRALEAGGQDNTTVIIIDLN